MRSSKAPPNQKIGGNFCPNPPEPTGAGIRTSPEPHRSRIELRAGVKRFGLGNVILFTLEHHSWHMHLLYMCLKTMLLFIFSIFSGFGREGGMT